MTAEWQRGVFRKACVDGDDVIVSGWFVHGKWGVSKSPSKELDRRFWGLTHLPTGHRVMYTSERKDAQLAGDVIGAIPGFADVKTVAEAKPYKMRIRSALEAAGLFYQGGIRFERWQLNDNDPP